MNVVLVMFKDRDRRDFPLSEEKSILGRRQDCHLRIPTRDVSRQHCEIVAAGDTLKVHDLGSSNGTFVNDKRVAETELKPGDRLRVGPVTFFVQVDGQPAKIKPEAEDSTSDVTPSILSESGDDDTFELSEADFDLDDPMSALDAEEDEDDMP
jgi:pSer/pThr/pTyr-binding forkhead associated (FHA) protein